MSDMSHLLHVGTYREASKPLGIPKKKHEIPRLSVINKGPI
jgi:hypothetical protein